MFGIESILTSIKKHLGIEESYTAFDNELIMNINQALSVLTQLGVGPESGFFISDASAKWEDFTKEKYIPLAIDFTYLRVRLLFDPPSSSSVIEAIKESIQEDTWRLEVMVSTEGGREIQNERTLSPRD